jgi:hypothetical protein
LRYEHVEGDITRYRDYEWRITELCLVLTFALTAGSLASPDVIAKLSPCVKLPVQLLILGLVLFSTGLGMYGLRYVHEALATNWKHRAELEFVLGVPDRFAHKRTGTRKEYYFRRRFNICFLILVFVVGLISCFALSSSFFPK